MWRAEMCELCRAYDPLGSLWEEASFQVLLFTPVTMNIWGDYPFLYCRVTQWDEPGCIFLVSGAEEVICQGSGCCLRTALAWSLVVTKLRQLTSRQLFLLASYLLFFCKRITKTWAVVCEVFIIEENCPYCWLVNIYTNVDVFSPKRRSG